MIIPGESGKPTQRALAKLLSLGLAGGMSAMELATAISERHPSVTTEALAALIARQQKKRRDELATLAALEVTCRAGGKTLSVAVQSVDLGSVSAAASHQADNCGVPWAPG